VFSVTEGCVIEGGNEPLLLTVSVLFGKIDDGQSPEVVTLRAM
jgi:hypothetical protein